MKPYLCSLALLLVLSFNANLFSQNFNPDLSFNKLKKVGFNGETYPLNYLTQAYNKIKLNYQRGGPLDWEFIGPHNLAGQANDILFDKNDPLLRSWYLASRYGGIWKTNDAAETWIHLTDNLPIFEVIALERLNITNTIFAATNSGIWTSSDDGNSWSVLANLPSDDFHEILNIVIDNNTNIILVASVGKDGRSHIFKSNDLGMNWSEKFEHESEINHIVFGNDNMVFAAIYGNENGIYKSDDYGESWSFLYKPNGYTNRFKIATKGESVYVAWYFPRNDFNGSGGLTRSTDNGNSWNFIVRTGYGELGPWLGGNAFNIAISKIGINNIDSDRVYLGGYSGILKLDIDNLLVGFQNWNMLTDINNSYEQNVGSKGVSGNHNRLIVKAGTDNANDTIFSCNSGGVAFSFDGGNSFIQTGDAQKTDSSFQTSSGLHITAINNVDKINGSDKYMFSSFTGTWISSESPSNISLWANKNINKGTDLVTNYFNPENLFQLGLHNKYFLSNDGGDSWLEKPLLFGSLQRTIAYNKANPNFLVIPSTSGLLLSDNFGNSFITKQVSPNWRHETFIGTPTAVSLASSNVIWSGAKLEFLNNTFISRNKGESFFPVASYPQASLGYITKIETHPSNPKKAYLLFSGPNAPKILATDDYGNSWKDLSGFNANTNESSNGFPNVGVNALLVMPFDTNQIWAGTEIGLFESLDGGKSWNYADNGFPLTPIETMKIVNDEILIGTIGRGFWKLQMEELQDYQPVDKIVSISETNETIANVRVFPNPSFGSIIVNVDLFKAGNFEVQVKNAQGQIILENTELTANTNSFNFPLELKQSGIYFIKLKKEKSIVIKKIIVQ